MAKLKILSRVQYAILGITVLVFSLLIPIATHAQKSNDGFALQVSPSPIVENIKPGETTSVEIVIRNTAAHPEDLKMGLRSFTVNDGGEVKLNVELPKEVSAWVSFADPLFTVEAGKSFVERATFTTPLDAGFSYSFAIMVSRQKPTAAVPGKPAIEGSVAIFTLLSVDKPGATRKVDVLQFSSAKHVYEYLPATFSLKLKNSGNSILKPAGTIFVQRTENAVNPLASITLNENGAYILPDVSRNIDANWDSGFPYFKTNPNGKKSLQWNLSSLDKFRIGRYYAKAVVVYNDGVRDVPVNAVISFWVLPWKLLLGALVLIILAIVGFYTTIHKTALLARKKKHEKPKAE